jgi:hypothetical protein
MKFLLFFLFALPAICARAQNLQFYYDFRHSLDPKNNPRNYPSLYFEFFKGRDSGSFLIKVQNDFTGEQGNIGQHYLQISQTGRFWKPKIYIAIQYSGGLGIVEPGNYPFFISNAFSLGLSHPFQWKGGWFSFLIYYTYNVYPKASKDPLGSLYWNKGFFHYTLELAGDISLWTLNRNLGNAMATGLSGKRFYFFGEPQIWLNLNKRFAFGSKINLYYHVLSTSNTAQVYPTAAFKYKM